MDETVVLFWYLVKSGILTQNHIMYEQIKAFCYGSLNRVFPETNFQQRFPRLSSWMATNQFLHGKSSTYLFRGRGAHDENQRDISMSPMEWVQAHNFAGITPRSITSSIPSHTATNGIVKEDLLLLHTAVDLSNVYSIVRAGVACYPVIASMDGMAIKPSLQVSPNGIVGLTKPELFEVTEVREMLRKPEEDVLSFLKETSFNTQDTEVHLTTMDDKIGSFPVAVFFGVTTGGWGSVKRLYENVNTSIDKCQKCLEEDNTCDFLCQLCWNGKRVCAGCQEVGYLEWHPLMRPCTNCVQKDTKCQRLLQLGWSSDCESKQKAFMERVKDLYPIRFQQPFPDAAHNIKSVRSAIFWYWVELEGFLINLRLLLVLRKDPNQIISSKMRAAVSLKALKNKDRMCVETAVEVLTPSVCEALSKEKGIVTFVPELYTYWKQNLPGIVKCPFDAAIDEKTGIVFFTDIQSQKIFKSDFHCPANVVCVAGQESIGHRDGKNAAFKEPAGICLHGTSLYVGDAGNGCIRVDDVSAFLKKNRCGNHDVPAEDEEDTIPIQTKSSVTHTLNLMSTGPHALKKTICHLSRAKFGQELPRSFCCRFTAA